MFGSGFEKYESHIWNKQLNRYWAFGRSSQSIEDLLNNPDCTLEKLMDEEDFLQELRNMNSKLLQLFDFSHFFAELKNP